MADIEPAERGRPTKYLPEFNVQARKLCLLGATDPELANFFGICNATLYNWKNVYPEFDAAIQSGKITADAHLANKLYNRAGGAEWEEQQVIKVRTGQFTEELRTVTVKRASPPDTIALIFWLKNRQPGKWRDTQALQQLDKDGNPTDVGMRVQIEYLGDPAPLRQLPSEATTERRSSVDVELLG